MDTFDADVLIYAAHPGHELGTRVRALMAPPRNATNVGSTLLVTEVLTKPVRQEDWQQVNDLRSILATIHMHDVTAPISDLAVDLGAKYGLRARDAVHLATAVMAGADRFVTNNRRDFRKQIAEVDITYPDELPAA
jgi:predicted nucleic acid-binding protein